MLRLTTEVVRKSQVVRIAGYISCGNVSNLRERLLAVAEGAPRVLALDLSEVLEMSSAGVAVLIELRRKLGASGRVLGIVGLSESVIRVVELLQAGQVICDVYKVPRANQPAAAVREIAAEVLAS
jgi:anti-anti-sigma factor